MKIICITPFTKKNIVLANDKYNIITKLEISNLCIKCVYFLLFIALDDVMTVTFGLINID